MAEEKQGQSVAIAVALIGLVGVLGAAAIANWDKITGRGASAGMAAAGVAPAPAATVPPPAATASSAAATPPAPTPPRVEEAPITPQAAASAPSAPPPDFSGDWVQVGVPAPARVTITQAGDQVTMGEHTMTIRDDGSIGYQTFAAGPSPGHMVQSAEEADLIDTFNWSRSGPQLVFTTIFDTRHPYGGDPVGVKTRVMRYVREKK
jgi:hypothetical protein